MTVAAVEVLMNRVHQLEITLEMAASRLEIVAKGGKLAPESAADMVDEIKAVLTGQPLI